MRKLEEWLKANRNRVILVAVFIVVVGFAYADYSEKEQERMADVEPKQEKKEAVEEPMEDTSEESESVESDMEDVETEIEEPTEDELSIEFSNNAGQYLMQLSESYMTLGDLETATSESEMMDIVKQAQMQYDDTNVYFTKLEPQNDKEQELYDKILDIDTLASSALINAEDGLIESDPSLIQQATDDIESSGNIADTIVEDIE